MLTEDEQQFLADNLSDEQLDQLALLRHEAERERCKLDLFYLTKHVLGYAELGDFHKPLCDIVQSVNPLLSNVYNNSNNTGNDNMRNRGYTPPKIFLCPPTENFIENSEPSKGSTQSLSQENSLSRSRSFEDFRIGDETRRAFEGWLEFNPRARERLFMMFRGSFKTTIISIAHTIQLMLLYPDIRILLCSHKKEGGAGEILYAIKRHFIGNKRFRALFPDYCPTPNTQGVIEWGTQERVLLPNRSPNCAWPEATIEIAGTTTDVTGRHYDYIKNDDLVTRDSVTNETMLAKTREMKALQKFLFNQPEWGITDNVGTPYHFNDLYSTLRKGRDITKVQVPASTEPLACGAPIFPERFTIEGLKRVLNDPMMGSYEYSCQYDLNPVPPSDQTFRPEWLEREGFFYDRPPENLKIYIFIDPASRRRKSSDYTAIITIGLDEKGTIYLLDIIRDKFNAEHRTNKALEIAQKYDIHKIHYETIGFQDTDKFIIERKARERKYWITVEQMTARGTSKEDRIRGLQPIYERGDIRWPLKYDYYSQYEGKRLDMVSVLRDEMLMFPKVDHDDLLDAHSQLLQVTLTNAQEVKEVEKPDAFMWWRKQAIKAKTTEPHRIGHFRKKPKYVQIPAKTSWR